VSSMEAFAASGRAPKRVVDGGRDWREKRRAGEDVSGQNKAKTRIGKYQRARGGTAVLRVASATRVVLGEGSSPAVVRFERRTERGRGEG